jgi:non-homologous end joining protein Ku
LRRLVKRKAAGKKIEAPVPEEESGKVIDLMEALRRSLHGKGGGKASAPAKGKRKAARRGRKAA